MKFSECRPLDEIFSHDPGDEPVRHFNATRMAEAAPGLIVVEKVVVGIDQKHADFIRENRGIERWKLDRLKEPYLSRPLVLVKEADGTHTTVDGNHRFVKLVELGKDRTAAYIFPFGTWEQFLIEDMPDAVKLIALGND